MPLTKKGKEILKSFIKRYNGETGTRFFYAYIKKFPRRTRGWHEG